jgi:hypothetical protein
MVVEIRMAGVPGGLLRTEWPGCKVAVAPALSVICGRFGENESLASVLAVLSRHGLSAVDAWVVAPSRADARDDSPSDGSVRAHGVNGAEIDGSGNLFPTGLSNSFDS